MRYRFSATSAVIANISASAASAPGESAGIEAPTVVVTLDVLFAGLGSGLVDDAVAVFVTTVPAGTPSGTLNTKWNDPTLPLPSVAVVQVIDRKSGVEGKRGERGG